MFNIVIIIRKSVVGGQRICGEMKKTLYLDSSVHRKGPTQDSFMMERSSLGTGRPAGQEALGNEEAV